MKTKILFLFLILSIAGFAQTQQTYEYLSMTQIFDKIEFNKDSESFETINVKSEMSKNRADYRPLLKRIQEYEKQGWEMVSNNVYTLAQEGYPRNYVIMRRKK